MEDSYVYVYLYLQLEFIFREPLFEDILCLCISCIYNFPCLFMYIHMNMSLTNTRN